MRYIVNMTIDRISSDPLPSALGRTSTATRNHLVECPHLVGRDWYVASETEADLYPLCDWSQNQLGGTGRTHFATVADAMRLHGTPTAVAPLINEALRFVRFDDIWTVYNQSYVALGYEGRAVASFGKTWVQVGDHRIELPGYVAGEHQGHHAQPAYGDTCPVHFVAMSLGGTCDDCD
jgi:hypothetical protein